MSPGNFPIKGILSPNKKNAPIIIRSIPPIISSFPIWLNSGDIMKLPVLDLV